MDKTENKQTVSQQVCTYTITSVPPEDWAKPWKHIYFPIMLSIVQWCVLWEYKPYTYNLDVSIAFSYYPGLPVICLLSNTLSTWPHIMASALAIPLSAITLCPDNYTNSTVHSPGLLQGFAQL